MSTKTVSHCSYHGLSIKRLGVEEKWVVGVHHRTQTQGLNILTVNTKVKCSRFLYLVRKKEF